MHISPSASSQARPTLIVAAVLTTSLIFPLSITGPAAALPILSAELGAHPLLPWIVTAYNASFAAFLLFGGLLADWLGPRAVYVGGVSLFAAAALTLTLSSTPELLVAARGLAGIAAAAATTGGTALLSGAVAPSRRPRVFGALGTVMGAGLAFGPILSAFLVAQLGWRGAFAVPGGLAVAALLVLAMAGLKRQGDSEARDVSRPPLGAAALFTCAFLALTLGLGELPTRGLGDPITIGAFVAAGAFGALMVRLNRRGTAPLVPHEILTSRGFSAIAVAAGTLMAVLVPLVVFLPTALTDRGGNEAALATLFLTIPTVILPAAGARIARRIAATTLAWCSLVLAALGLAGVGAALATGAPLSGLAPGLLAIGAAVGLTSGVLDGAALAEVPEAVAARAAGMLNTARLASETLTLAVTSAVVLGAAGAASLALAPVAAGLAALALLSAGVVLLLSRRPRFTAQ